MTANAYLAGLPLSTLTGRLSNCEQRPTRPGTVPYLCRNQPAAHEKTLDVPRVSVSCVVLRNRTVGFTGLEPVTSCVSSRRSSQLS